jgi:hypothetical protein
MFGIGIPELLIVVPLLLISAAIPITSVVLIILMYIKINRIEQILNSKLNQRPTAAQEV